MIMVELRFPKEKEKIPLNSVRAVGAEQCCVLFLHETQRFLTENDVFPNKITLVTPKTNEIFFKSVVERIEELISRYEIDSIVVNDFGILKYLRDIKNTIDITIGRILLGSFGYRDTMDGFIHPEESDEVVKNVLAPSILHRDKIELFLKYNVKAVEICHTPFERLYMELLKKYPVNIHLHYGTHLVALSKACYRTTWNGSSSMCGVQCKEVERLKLAHISGYNPLDKHSMSEETFLTKQRAFPELFLAGNAVYRRVEEQEYSSLFTSQECARAAHSVRAKANEYSEKYYDRIIVDERLVHNRKQK